MSALVSIIVPVYNLEDYIENCINSLLNQTYKNIEIICIDDGSSDGSARIIKEFSDKDSRVIYIFQENSGVSAARNKGLDVSTGDYIMFVDGDDYLHFQAVEVLLYCIEKNNCDIVGSRHFSTNSFDELGESIVVNDIIAHTLSDVLEKTSYFEYRTVWGKLYKRDIVTKNRFPLGISNGEDTVFLFKVLSAEPKIVQIDLPLYFYYNRQGSISNCSFNMPHFSVVEGLNDLCCYLKNIDSDFLLSQSVILLFKAIFSNRMRCIGSEYENTVLMRCKQVGLVWIDYLIRSNHISIKKKISFILFFFSRRFYELARLIQDPTMKDFYRNRKKRKD